jgi:N-acyl-L-homoserine lactone synthetase
MTCEHHTPADECPALLDEMFKMRARVFGERLGWDVTVREGRERDEYDDLDPSYITIESDGKLCASVRLMPTTGRTMLAEHFPQFLSCAPAPSPRVWEATRFCVEDTHFVPYLGEAMTQFGLARGITSFIACFDSASWRIYRKACASVGCRLDILGAHLGQHGERIYIGEFEVSTAVLSRLREALT